MKLGRIGPIGAEVPVALHEGGYRDLRPLVSDLAGDALSPEGLRRIASELDALPVVAGAAGLRRGAPIARPGAIICIGMNYAAHAAES
ncbi:ureidoglycolate lyase, partial [Klebsiella pneumoniae]